MGPTDPENPQVIMYTSWTTGPAKGAVLSYRKTFFNCLNADIFFDLSFDDVMLVVLPLFHSGGLFIQASPILYKGGTLVIHPRFDPDTTFRDIELYKITKFLGVPTVYRMLIEAVTDKRHDLSSLKVSAIGGEKVMPGLMTQCRRAGFPVRQIMGQTETSILFWAPAEACDQKPGAVGRPVFHAEVGLMDPDGRPVPAGEIGEIAVRGAVMMSGYWRDPAKTRETIRNGWLYTGDIARMDADGYFYLVDRAKDMYISGGENVYPAEVESVLKEHPAVEEAAVVGVPDDKWGEVGKAFVIRRNGATISADQIIDYCRGRLAPFKWPKEIVFCRDFPRTPLGKVKKQLLVTGY
jgi:fatty-acyl-CoA synthase